VSVPLPDVLNKEISKLLTLACHPQVPVVRVIATVYCPPPAHTSCVVGETVYAQAGSLGGDGAAGVALGGGDGAVAGVEEVLLQAGNTATAAPMSARPTAWRGDINLVRLSERGRKQHKCQAMAVFVFALPEQSENEGYGFNLWRESVSVARRPHILVALTQPSQCDEIGVRQQRSVLVGDEPTCIEVNPSRIAGVSEVSHSTDAFVSSGSQSVSGPTSRRSSTRATFGSSRSVLRHSAARRFSASRSLSMFGRSGLGLRSWASSLAISRSRSLMAGATVRVDATSTPAP